LPAKLTAREKKRSWVTPVKTKRNPLTLLCVAILMISGLALADGQQRGADDMVLAGGKTGSVPFPHHRHQDAMGDCMACHTLFPQKAGSIEVLKAEGKLRKKAVMNSCSKCHRNLATAGRPSGPTSCKDCHSRKEG
jgi:hypothetical protein